MNLWGLEKNVLQSYTNVFYYIQEMVEHSVSLESVGCDAKYTPSLIIELKELSSSMPCPESGFFNCANSLCFWKFSHINYDLQIFKRSRVPFALVANGIPSNTTLAQKLKPIPCLTRHFAISFVWTMPGSIHGFNWWASSFSMGALPPTLPKVGGPLLSSVT
jgi:hypothetical protein